MEVRRMLEPGTLVGFSPEGQFYTNVVGIIAVQAQGYYVGEPYSNRVKEVREAMLRFIAKLTHRTSPPLVGIIDDGAYHWSYRIILKWLKQKKGERILQDWTPLRLAQFLAEEVFPVLTYGLPEDEFMRSTSEMVQQALDLFNYLAEHAPVFGAGTTK